VTVERATPVASVLADLLFEEPGVGRCLVGPDGIVLRVNGEWLRSAGCSAGEVLGADIVDLFPQARDAMLAMHARARAGHPVETPRQRRRVEGRDTWWEGRISPVPMEGGNGILVTAREVAPGIAEDMQARLAAIVESTEDAIIGKGLDGRWSSVARRNT
jgi:PAS domain S-box-containing protein